MSDRIAIADLEATVAKAVAHIKIKPGPIILGFIAPDAIAQEEAHGIAAEVTRLSGIAGTPTVTTVAAAAAHGATVAGATERAHFVPPHHIIVGLILDER